MGKTAGMGVKLFLSLKSWMSMPPLKTILCVDDDPLARLLVQKSIEFIGTYNSAEAKSGKDCINFVSQNKVDLIILDYHLGDMYGVDICSMIPSISLNPDVPVIISSVVDTDIIKEQCDYKNLVKIVQKPYDVEAFYQDIEEVFS